MQKNAKAQKTEEDVKDQSENLTQYLKTEDNESESFLMKKMFMPVLKKTDASTRPQTSNSKSIQSEFSNYYKKIESPSNLNNTLTGNRPNSALIKYYDKTIQEELRNAGYLFSSLEKEKKENEEKLKIKVKSAKIEKEKEKDRLSTQVSEVGNTHKKIYRRIDIYEKYPQFKYVLQKSIMKDLKNY